MTKNVFHSNGQKIQLSKQWKLFTDVKKSNTRSETHFLMRIMAYLATDNSMKWRPELETQFSSDNRKYEKKVLKKNYFAWFLLQVCFLTDIGDCL